MINRRRTLPRRAAVVGAVALAAAAAAPAALAASLRSPATATLGGSVSVHASGLAAGRYQLFLAYTKPGGQNCVAAISSARTVGSSASFSGKVPSKLTCHTSSGAAAGSVPVTAGRYDVAVYSPVGANGYNGRLSFIQRSITID